MSRIDIIKRQASEELTERLGADLKLPVDGSFTPIKGIDVLLQDSQQLLLTMPGERVNRPNWGCTLRRQIWENLRETAETGAQSITQAIEEFEPRVTLLSVTSQLNENTGLITFNIQFIINEIDSPLNLIFPFRSGTSLSFS